LDASKKRNTVAEQRVYYHVTMQPHRRLPALCGEIEACLVAFLAEFVADREFHILEVGVVPTHIHILLEKAPWADLIAFIKEFQVQSSERVFARFPQLALDMGTNQFWTRGGFHYRRHTTASVETVRRYVRGQKRRHGLE
jgi:REP element-mobilizing transposase RayT